MIRPPARRADVLRHILTSPVRAIGDAARAWQIAPHFYASDVREPNEKGGMRLASRQPYSIPRKILAKVQCATQAFWNDLHLGFARNVVIRRFGTEGVMANLLHMLEVSSRVRPDARVHVDWIIRGKEGGFRYGQVGENVWTGLFAQVDPHPDTPKFYLARYVLDYALWGLGKDSLKDGALQRQRNRYHKTICEFIEVTNQRVRKEIADIEARFFIGRFCIGVHRRVGSPIVTSLQYDGAVPSLDRLVECVRAKIRSSHAADWIVYLATDDAEAVPVFSREFGERLVVRDRVQRTTADKSEVHWQDWGRVSLSDAEDVLIDSLLLARCTVLVHASSSVSTLASFLNPKLHLVRVGRDL